LLTRNCDRDQEFLESLVAEVEKNVDGRRVTKEGEDDDPAEAKEYDASQFFHPLGLSNIVSRS